MKYCILIFFHCILVQFLFAQKPALGLKDYGTWPQMSNEAISSDGRYVLYQIQVDNSDPHLLIQSTDHSYKKEIIAARYGAAAFTDDANHVIFITQGDSICILDLHTLRDLFVPNVQSYKLAENGGQSYLAMLQTSNDLLLYNLTTGDKKNYTGVNDYSFDGKGTQLLLQRTQNKDSVHTANLELIDLAKGTGKIIWEGEQASNYAFSNAGTSITFVVETKAQKETKNTIWIYHTGFDKATLLLDDQGLKMNGSFYVAKNDLKFSSDGQKLFFSVKRNLENDVPALKDVGVHIWNYQDPVLPPAIDESRQREKYQFYTAVINLNATDKKVVLLEREKNLFRGVQLINGGNSEYAIETPYGNLSEISWNQSAKLDLCLVSTKTGSIKYIKKDLSFVVDPQISPDGKYVLWYDQEQRAWFTYNIEKGTIKNISKRIPAPIFWEDYEGAYYPPENGPPVWLANDESVLLYDKYDIWKVDLEGIKLPINITGGYGRKNKIILRYVYSKGGDFLESSPVDVNDSILLCAFDEVTKFNGFYKIKLGSTKPPTKMIMAPYIMYSAELPIGRVVHAEFILKAKQADIYLIKRMNAGEYPNLQMTSDFKSFEPLTDLAPQKKVNWLTSELVKWKTFKGKDAEGILYKPENFDPQKKYSVILYFYQRMSAGLNQYLEPELARGPINIPFLVSQGYLVFCPDVHGTVGDPGESAYEYVVSAAKMLSTKSWVDGKHMGIQGHSYGGYEVNYLVTRTNLFAAAASADGVSDMISDYGSLKGSIGVASSDNHLFMEIGQYQMSTTLWQDPSRYIRNSPIFGANKVNTPLLIMHGEKDIVVPWAQGVEFYTGLRRLNKKVWMLQYDKANHVIYDRQGQLDYTTRLQQYFDHYLKEAPAPRWMIKDLPANEIGCALDPSGYCSKDCKVCTYWNEKMKKDPAATMKEIEEKEKSEHWIGNNQTKINNQ